MFTDFLQNCIDGLMVGSGYALLALGFTMVFGVMKRLNLSYGPSIMLGAYFGTWLYLNLEQNAWLVLLGTISGTVLVGIYVERLCFRAIRGDSTIASMVSSFVIWMQLEENCYAFASRENLYISGFLHSNQIRIRPLLCP